MNKYSNLSPELKERIQKFKNYRSLIPDSRNEDEKEQSRNYFRQRISDYKKQNNELLQMKQLIETRIGEPLKLINRESPSTKFFNSAKSKKTGGKKHKKTAKKHK